ncbi:MAG: FAD-dependent oxidoreductase [Candidatus Alcyoniella australis]|nr:FAD-dependent oxidoreductase [Candidatus Alcyoniella australis]
MDLGDLSLDLSGLDRQQRPDHSTTYDLLIIGGGPAAMSAAVYASRKLLKTALLADDLGGQVGWTSEIENYLGFQSISGKELVTKFSEQVKQFDVPIARGEKVVEVTKPDELFRVRSAGGAIYSGRAVIVATGKRNRKLGVPGEDRLLGRGVAICAICDAPFYSGRKVAVAGGGNSAFTAALDLLKVGAEVLLINFAQGWQADEILIESAQNRDKLTLLDMHQITQISGEQTVEEATILDRRSGEQREVELQGVFIEIGLDPNSEPVAALAELTDHRELKIDCHCRTSVPGLYGAGDVTTVPYKQIVISAGEGAKAALAAYEDLIMSGRI